MHKKINTQTLENFFKKIKYYQQLSFKCIVETTKVKIAICYVCLLHCVCLAYGK